MYNLQTQIINGLAGISTSFSFKNLSTKDKLSSSECSVRVAVTCGAPVVKA
jgi:hypothetical protein